MYENNINHNDANHNTDGDNIMKHDSSSDTFQENNYFSGDHMTSWSVSRASNNNTIIYVIDTFKANSSILLVAFVKVKKNIRQMYQGLWSPILKPTLST